MEKEVFKLLCNILILSIILTCIILFKNKSPFVKDSENIYKNENINKEYLIKEVNFKKVKNIEGNIVKGYFIDFMNINDNKEGLLIIKSKKIAEFVKEGQFIFFHSNIGATILCIEDYNKKCFYIIIGKEKLTGKYLEKTYYEEF